MNIPHVFTKMCGSCHVIKYQQFECTQTAFAFLTRNLARVYLVTSFCRSWVMQHRIMSYTFRNLKWSLQNPILKVTNPGLSNRGWLLAQYPSSNDYAGTIEYRLLVAIVQVSSIALGFSRTLTHNSYLTSLSNNIFRAQRISNNNFFFNSIENVKTTSGIHVLNRHSVFCGVRKRTDF